MGRDGRPVRVVHMERRRDVDDLRWPTGARFHLPLEVRLGVLGLDTLQMVQAPREIGWTGKTMGIQAVHVFHFEPSGGGTSARSAESFRGLIPSVFKKYSHGVLQRGIDGILASLKTEAERRASTPGG